MSPKQKKIAAKAPPPNVFNEKDLAVLREEKAKGRGMGLQDEKVKPGKVMKANLGILAMKKAKDKGAKGAEFLSPLAMAKRMFNKKAGGVMKYKRGSGLDLPVISSVKPKTGKKDTIKALAKKKGLPKPLKTSANFKGVGKFPYVSMAEMRKAKGFKPGESASEFNKRRMALDVAKKAAKSTRIGKMLLPVAAAGVAAQQYLKGKMKKDKNKKTLKDFREQKKPGVPSEKTKTINSALNKLSKKMGGGMMKKPMGYKTGRSISTRGGGVDSSIIGKIRDAGPFKPIPLGKSRLTDEDRKKIRELMQKKSSRKKGLDTAKRVASTVASVASPLTAAASAGYKFAKRLKNKDSDSDKAKSMVGTSGSKNRPIKKDHSSRNPNPKTPKMMGGGMMMQRPMGYKYGTSVTAKCKLGRNKPTKIT